MFIYFYLQASFELTNSKIKEIFSINDFIKYKEFNTIIESRENSYYIYDITDREKIIFINSQIAFDNIVKIDEIGRIRSRQMFFLNNKRRFMRNSDYNYINSDILQKLPSKVIKEAANKFIECSSQTNKTISIVKSSKSFPNAVTPYQILKYLPRDYSKNIFKAIDLYEMEVNGKWQTSYKSNNLIIKLPNYKKYALINKKSFDFPKYALWYTKIRINEESYYLVYDLINIINEKYLSN